MSSVHCRLSGVLGRGMRHRDECMRAAEDLSVKASWRGCLRRARWRVRVRKQLSKDSQSWVDGGAPGANTLYEGASLRLTLGVER